MMNKAWSSIEEVPYCFSRSFVKFKGRTDLKILKFERRPWKIIGRLFYATWRFVNHSIAICVFKLELQSGNANLGRNREFFVPCDLEIWRMTLTNKRTTFLTTWRFVHHFIAISEFKLELQSRNAQFGSKSGIVCPIRRWNLTNDLLLCYFQPCASFHSHLWIQTEVRVWKSPIWHQLSVSRPYVTPVWIHWCLWNNAESLT